MKSAANFEKTTKALVAFNTELTSGGVRSALSAAEATNPGKLWMVDITQIQLIPGFNPRIHDERYEAHIEFIKDSMLQEGFNLSKPLEIFVDSDGKLNLTDGYTRYDAYLRALKEGLKDGPVPVVPRPKGTSMEDLTIGLVRSNSGQRLTAYETAIVVKRLAVTYHHTPKEIAEMLSMSEKYAGQLLDLAAAPAAVREMVQNGEVTASLAIEALAKHKDGATAFLQAAVGKAAGLGKGKATKKDTITPEELRVKREKKLAGRLFAAVELLLADKKIIEVINPEVYKEIDTILFERDKENEAAPPKAKAKAKAKAKPDAK